MSRTRTPLTVCLCFASLGLLGGCGPQPKQARPTVNIVPETHEQPPKTPPGPDPYKMTVEEVEKAPLESDIVEVHTHYNLFPWLQYDPSDPEPQGLVISALFFVSGRTGKGAFADGLITVKMYRVDRDAQRHETRALVHTWQFTPQQAMPYRAVRRTVIGEGYQLHLRWPKELNVINREIVVLVEFTRLDGKVIRSASKFLKVPEKVNG